MNNDEVMVKPTKEIVKVISLEVYEKDVFLYAMTKDAYTKLHHSQIK